MDRDVGDKVSAMAQLIPPRGRRRLARRGATLAEQMVVLTVTGILMAISVAAGAPLLDALAVETASQEIADLIGTARDHAFTTQQRTAVRIDAAAARVVVHAGTDTIAHTTLGSGLQLQTTRDSLAYAPSGLGYGAANLRITVSRGGSADTITVSRLGRVSRF
jgi:hypothetical protein